MSSVNKVILVGRLGRDPESRYTESGKLVVNFTLATDFKGKTEWHKIVAWTKTAEIIEQYVKKGDLLYVEGRLQNREYDDKKTGTKKYITEVVAGSVQMLSGKKQAAESTSEGEPAEEPTEEGVTSF